MTTMWFETLRLELDTLEPEHVVSPNNGVGDDERVIAVIEDEELRRLYALCRRYSYLARHAPVDAAYIDDGRRTDDAESFVNRARILGMLFWHEVRVRLLPRYDAPEDIGIRADWQVVALPPSPFATVLGL